MKKIILIQVCLFLSLIMNTYGISKINNIRNILKKYDISLETRVYYVIPDEEYGKFEESYDPGLWTANGEERRYIGGYATDYYYFYNKLFFKIAKSIGGNLLMEYQPFQRSLATYRIKKNKINLWLYYKFHKGITFEFNIGRENSLNEWEPANWVFYNSYPLDVVKLTKIYNNYYETTFNYVLLKLRIISKNVSLIPILKIGQNMVEYIKSYNIYDPALWKRKYEGDIIKKFYYSFTMEGKWKLNSKIYSTMSINFYPDYWTKGGKWSPLFISKVNVNFYYNISKYFQYQVGGNYFYKKYNWENPYNPPSWTPSLETTDFKVILQRYMCDIHKTEVKLWSGVKITP